MSEIDFSIYSRQTYNDHINKYERCGDETIRFVNARKPLVALDLGCGNNVYKPFIPNLVGIDIANVNADINADISKLDYADNSVDAILALGSINFGDESTIRQQLSEVNRVLKPGAVAIFRGNESNQHPYYGWNERTINYWAREFKFVITYKPVHIHKLDVWGKPLLKNRKDKRTLNGEIRSNIRLYWHYSKSLA